MCTAHTLTLNHPNPKHEVSGQKDALGVLQIAYNASKAAVVKITQTLGCEWADRGVAVNCMSPGIVNTALIQVCAGQDNLR